MAKQVVFPNKTSYFPKQNKLFSRTKSMGTKKSRQPLRTTGKHPKWALTDSNRRPSACKADALNQLS